MRSVETLPEGYREIYALDFQKDKKTAIIANLLSFLIVVVMVVPVHFIVPITSVFSMAAGVQAYLFRVGTLFALVIIYVVLHELTHGMAMKICGTKKVTYGLTGAYAYAGSTDFYNKKAYAFVALSPIVLWGIVLAVVNFFVPVAWFWVIYLVQVGNVSGAAGDLYVIGKSLKLPNDILVQDSGLGMKFYSRD